MSIYNQTFTYFLDETMEDKTIRSSLLQRNSPDPRIVSKNILEQTLIFLKDVFILNIL